MTDAEWRGLFCMAGVSYHLCTARTALSRGRVDVISRVFHSSTTFNMLPPHKASTGRAAGELFDKY